MHISLTGRGVQNEDYKPELARLATASALYSAKVPALQFSKV
jgi:hypothetical protein